jgi:hypothetical protein
LPSPRHDPSSQLGPEIPMPIGFHKEGRRPLSRLDLKDTLDGGKLLPDLGIRAFNLETDLQGSSQLAGEVCRRVGGDNLPPVDDEDPLADLTDFGKDVTAQNDRALPGELFDECPDFHDLGRIETDGRLIENKNWRIIDEGLGDAEPLAIPFGKVTDDSAPHLFDTASLHDPLHLVAAARTGYPLGRGGESEKTPDGHVCVKRYGLREIADFCPNLERMLPTVQAGNASEAGGRWDETGKNPERCGLPGTVRSQESKDFALVHAKANLAQRWEWTIKLGKPLHFDHGTRSLWSIQSPSIDQAPVCPQGERIVARLATAKKGGLKTTLALTAADLVNQKSKIRLFPNLSGPHRGAAVLAQVLVELTIGKKKEEPLPNRRSLPALRAEQGRGP